MTITALPTPPSRANSPSDFSTKADALLGALPQFVTEANALASAVNTDAESANADALTASNAVASAMAAGLANAATNASIATTQAGIATTKAAEAAASAASISGGPVTSVNGMTGIITGVATQTGTETLTNKTLTGYTETVYALSGTAIAEANGSIQAKTLSANTTFTESLADGQSVILGITAGSYSVTWPAGMKWAKVGGSGTAPTLTSTGVNWIVLWKVGGTLRGAFLGTA